MDLQSLVVIVVVTIMGMFMYSQAKLKGKLLCYFHRPNRTLIEKMIPLRSKYVKFDGGRYRVNPKFISLVWYNRGIHQFFPTLVPSLTYKWDTNQPLNPTTFENTWDTPEAREASGQEDEFRAFARAVQAAQGKRGSVLESYLPYISIGLTVIVAYLVYEMSRHIGVLEQLIRLK